MRAHVEIPLTGGEVALVDVDDWALVQQYAWSASRERWAAQAYNAAALEAWGEFAYLNERIVATLLGGADVIRQNATTHTERRAS